jgi:CBS domain-containing protein
MTIHPLVATPDQKIDEVSKIMLEKRLNGMPVVDGLHLVGMITTHDLWRNSVEHGSTEYVKDIMSTNVIKISPLDKVGTAAELFMDKRFKTLPVVNLRNELKGVVTAFDVMRHTLKREYPTSILYKDIIEEKA